jgi:hypothetical protein
MAGLGRLSVDAGHSPAMTMGRGNDLMRLLLGGPLPGGIPYAGQVHWFQAQYDLAMLVQ